MPVNPLPELSKHIGVLFWTGRKVGILDRQTYRRTEIGHLLRGPGDHRTIKKATQKNQRKKLSSAQRHPTAQKIWKAI